MNGTCVILLVLKKKTLPPKIKHLWEVNGNCSHSRLPRLLHPVSSSSERFVMYMDKKKKSAFTYLRASLNTSQLLLYKYFQFRWCIVCVLIFCIPLSRLSKSISRLNLFNHLCLGSLISDLCTAHELVPLASQI